MYVKWYGLHFNTAIFLLFKLLINYVLTFPRNSSVDMGRLFFRNIVAIFEFIKRKVKYRGNVELLFIAGVWLWHKIPKIDMRLGLAAQKENTWTWQCLRYSSREFPCKSIHHMNEGSFIFMISSIAIGQTTVLITNAYMIDVFMITLLVQTPVIVSIFPENILQARPLERAIMSLKYYWYTSS